ncbi:DUF5392 family protein [Halobacillus mangrovi]|uniref:Uncharacterized protein n=1 Tax=Halobacillus mangrovi TaxID=402384 RepID=A0A1W5ZWK7_9BACI|nr:DUF5392 family protein [Halobacillus mangrovi]ARI77658.1 hypothetical protein HM131_12725 [Halobacillus mangrovi]
MKSKHKHLPAYIVDEFKELDKVTKPLFKKMRGYALLSFIAIPISFINILSLFLAGKTEPIYIFPLLFFSIVGAFGLALQREVKFLYKEIQATSVQFIKERIRKTEVMHEHKRKNYMELIVKEPFSSINLFAEFLEEERRLKTDK